jgi:hypothetical protein
MSHEQIKTGVDVAAVAGGVGSWLSWLPDIAALLSIIWLALRIWDRVRGAPRRGKEPRR